MFGRHLLDIWLAFLRILVFSCKTCGFSLFGVCGGLSFALWCAKWALFGTLVFWLSMWSAFCSCSPIKNLCAKVEGVDHMAVIAGTDLESLLHKTTATQTTSVSDLLAKRIEKREVALSVCPPHITVLYGQHM